MDFFVDLLSLLNMLLVGALEPIDELHHFSEG